MTLTVLLLACADPSTGFVPALGETGASDTRIEDTGQPPPSIAKVVFIGDSITVGTSTEDEDRYVTLLSQDLRERFDGVEILDLSHPGMRLDGLLRTVPPELEATWPPPIRGGLLMIGTIGTGDMLWSKVWDQAQDHYLEGLTTLDGVLDDPDRFPDGAWLVLANIYDPTDGLGQMPGCYNDEDQSETFASFAEANQATHDLAAAQGWTQVDIRTPFLGHGARHADPTYEHYDPAEPDLWYVDCLHPSPRGHEEIRHAFRTAIDGLGFRTSGSEAER